MNKSTQTPAANSPRSKLTDALWRYHYDSDAHALRRAYNTHVAHEAKPKKSASIFHAILHAVDSFVIAPRRDHTEAIFKNRTDAEAIASDWAMVGEDLSHAMSVHILSGARAGRKSNKNRAPRC